MRREKCVLHPLIHTLLELNLAQDIESGKKAELVFGKSAA